MHWATNCAIEVAVSPSTFFSIYVCDQAACREMNSPCEKGVGHPCQRLPGCGKPRDERKTLRNDRTVGAEFCLLAKLFLIMIQASSKVWQPLSEQILVNRREMTWSDLIGGAIQSLNCLPLHMQFYKKATSQVTRLHTFQDPLIHRMHNCAWQGSPWRAAAVIA